MQFLIFYFFSFFPARLTKLHSVRKAAQERKPSILTTKHFSAFPFSFLHPFTFW